MERSQDCCRNPNGTRQHTHNRPTSGARMQVESNKVRRRRKQKKLLGVCLLKFERRRVGIDGGTSVDFQTGNKVGGQGCNRLFFCQSAANRGTMCESKRETAFSAGWCVCKREKKVMVQVSSVETPSIRGTRSWESLTKGNGAERFQVGKQWEQLMQVN